MTIDQYTARSQAGWSLLVHGTAEVVTDPDELRRLEPIARPSWVPVGPDAMSWIMVRPAALTEGR